MAQYTTSIAEYTTNFGILNPELTLEQQMQQAIDFIFDFEFQWVNSDPKSLSDFQELFILHFWEQEIGFETIGLFRLKLRETFLRLFPKWKSYYDAMEQILTLSQNNPLFNILVTTSSNKEIEENKSDQNTFDSMMSYTGNVQHKQNNEQNLAGNDRTTLQHGRTDTLTLGATTENQQINSDNPQTNFAGTDYAASMTRGQTKEGGRNTSKASGSDITSVDYSSTNTQNNALNDIYDRQDKHSGRDVVETDRILNDDTIIKESGYRGESLFKELERYRLSFKSVYELILDDCEHLFMGVYSNPYMSGGAW